jgi:3-(3-hydroxy-phenyl)propionate hydroxylase
VRANLGIETGVTRTQVLVAGGGPVGAVAAYRLALAGIDTILLEERRTCPEDMRASTLHAPTLEMLAELGVLGELEKVGLRAPVYQYRNRRSGDVIEFDLGELVDVTAYPYRLQCEQFKLARLLTSKLEAHPHGQTLFQRRMLGYEQDSDGVTATIETPMGIDRIRADYLIGADGADSTVRKWTGTRFEGFTYPERFLTLSTRYPIDQHFENLAQVNYVSDRDEWCVLLRVPEFWRVLVQAPSDATDAELLADSKKNAIFDGLTGDGKAIETHHRTLYRVHQRVVEQFTHGRVILAGDAAHLNNPLGGFGMNSGIHDVWNLTGKLRDVILDGADAEAGLSHYHRQRQAIARSFVQTQTIANKKMLESPSGDGRSDAEVRMAAIAGDADLRRAYLLRQSMFESLRDEAGIL